MIPEFSFDDGHPLDLAVADILAGAGFSATFYIPTNCGLTIQEIRRLRARGFKIGSHTVTHPSDLKALADAELDREISLNKSWLESIIGEPVTSFCYPRGRFDDRVKAAVRKAGFAEARTTVVGQVSPPGDPFAKATSVHVFQRDEYDFVPWPDYARAKFLAAASGGYFHLWGHSWEIDRLKVWPEFIRLVSFFCENLPA